MLFSTSAPSREIGAKMPVAAITGARNANSSSEPPITSASSARMNTPRVGSLAKRVHRIEDAGAHQERAAQRQGERADGQQDGPDLQRLALLHHDGGMQQRGAGEPGQQRGVLHRVPEPVAAPAEFVIRPPGAERDAAGQQAPGGQRPGPHPASPGGIDAAFQQRGDGEGERDGEADIARVEHRRMEREAGVLQQRVHVAAVDRRRPHALQRIGRGQREQQEAGRGEAQHADDAGAQRGRQRAAERRRPRRRTTRGSGTTAGWSPRGFPRCR